MASICKNTIRFGVAAHVYERINERKQEGVGVDSMKKWKRLDSEIVFSHKKFELRFDN